MELWIRSQDKRHLLKVNDGLYIANGFTDTDDTFIGIKNVGHVGRYATEERALEVLDEIQNILMPKAFLNVSSIKPVGNTYIENCVVMQDYNAEAKWEQADTYVYEMPKE